MKKFLAILLLGLLFASSSAKAGYVGKGELKLSYATVDWFIKYLKGGYGKKPLVFLVTIDGNYSFYWYCPEATCAPGNNRYEIKKCEQKANRECKVFAKRRTVLWKNGINTKTKFNSRWSDAEIKAKLTELGFLGGTTSTTTKIEKKENKIKKKSEKKVNGDVVQELKELKQLYDDGVLTQKEFEKAKKKLLN